MNEQELRGLIEDGTGQESVTRRSFIATLLSLGVAAPIAGQLLDVHAGIAQAHRQWLASLPPSVQ